VPLGEEWSYEKRMEVIEVDDGTTTSDGMGGGGVRAVEMQPERGRGLQAGRGVRELGWVGQQRQQQQEQETHARLRVGPGKLRR